MQHRHVWFLLQWSLEIQHIVKTEILKISATFKGVKVYLAMWCKFELKGQIDIRMTYFIEEGFGFLVFFVYILKSL